MAVPVVPPARGEVGGDRGGPLLQDGGDEKATPNQELLVNVKRLWVCWELKEQRSCDGRRWCVAGGDGAMGLVEEGVVVWQDAVPNGQHIASNGGNRRPDIWFLAERERKEGREEGNKGKGKR